MSPENLGHLFRTGHWEKQEVAELVLGTVFSFLSWSSVFCIQQLPISRGTLSTLVAGSGHGKAPLQCASFSPHLIYSSGAPRPQHIGVHLLALPALERLVQRLYCHQLLN